MTSKARFAASLLIGLHGIVSILHGIAHGGANTGRRSFLLCLSALSLPLRHW